MKKIYVIAYNTFLESVRSKILYVLLFFAMVIICSSSLLGSISAGEENKVILNLGLSTISLFGVMISIFVGTSMVFNEIEKRTIYNIISKPVGRHQFFLGKYLGLTMTLLLIVIAMSAGFFLYLLLKGIPIHLGLFQAIYFEFMVILLITAFAIFFSAITTPILSAVFTISIYIVGNGIHTLKSMKLYAQDSGFVQGLYDVLYAIMPNLYNFNIKLRASYGMHVPLDEFLYINLYGFLYISAVLLLGLTIFQRRNF